MLDLLQLFAEGDDEILKTLSTIDCEIVERKKNIVNRHDQIDSEL